MMLPHSASTRCTLAPMRSAHSASPRAEHAIDADHDLVAVLDQVGDRGFHPGRTGARNRKGDFVIGAEDDAQQLLDILHQRHEFRDRDGPAPATPSPSARADLHWTARARAGFGTGGLSSGNCCTLAPLRLVDFALHRPRHIAMGKRRREQSYYYHRGIAKEAARACSDSAAAWYSDWLMERNGQAGGEIDRALIADLEAILGGDAIVSHRSELKVYECDGWTIEKSAPDLLVMPRTTARGQRDPERPLPARRRVCSARRRHRSFRRMPAVHAPVMICTSRMNRIVAVDIANRRVEVQPGVVNLHVTDAVKRQGYFYAPDPSSQSACTIGGNVAENSGGPHTLKYGVTTNHVLGVELVLPDGEVVELGGPAEEKLRLRPGRRDGRFRGHGGNRYARHLAADARAGELSHDAGVVRRCGHRDARGFAHHRGGHPAGRDRDDGPVDNGRGRGRVSRRLSA